MPWLHFKFHEYTAWKVYFGETYFHIFNPTCSIQYFECTAISVKLRYISSTIMSFKFTLEISYLYWLMNYSYIYFDMPSAQFFNYVLESCRKSARKFNYIFMWLEVFKCHFLDVLTMLKRPGFSQNFFQFLRFPEFSQNLSRIYPACT